MKGVFWLFAFVCSLVLLAGAYYVTSPSIRTMVDPRAPSVAKLLRPYVRNADESADNVAIESSPPAAAPSSGDRLPTAPAVAPAVPSAPPEPEVFDLKKLAANKAAWPAKVAILKAHEFPAVVNGKKVGDLIAPADTEVGLVTISGGKLGVEYKGGGAWLFVEETDLATRAMKK
jgi:hypothetical protein